MELVLLLIGPGMILQNWRNVTTLGLNQELNELLLKFWTGQLWQKMEPSYEHVLDYCKPLCKSLTAN